MDLQKKRKKAEAKIEENYPTTKTGWKRMTKLPLYISGMTFHGNNSVSNRCRVAFLSFSSICFYSKV